MAIVGSGLTRRGGRLLPVFGGVAGPTNPTALIFIGTGDSKGVGVYDNTVSAYRQAQDTAFTNVYNLRSRTPLGVSQQLPWDQAIPPDGNSYMSPYEPFEKQVAADTGIPVLILAHNWNGTSMAAANSQPAGNYWGVGNGLHESCIARANGTGAYAGAGTIKAAMDAYPGAVVAGLIRILGTNESQTTTFTEDTYYAATVAEDADFRARIFANGVSGATLGSTIPTLVLGLLPETISASRLSRGFETEKALRRFGGSGPNRLLKQPEGRSLADNLHETLAGRRLTGAEMAAMRTSTVAPTIQQPASTVSVYEGQALGWELFSDVPVLWTLTGNDAAKFEVYQFTDATDTNIVSSRFRYQLRWLSNATKTYASPDDANTDNTYEVTLNARNLASGVVSTLAVTVPVLPAYGTQTGTIGYTAPTAHTYNAAATGYGAQFVNSIPFGAGMNFVMIRRSSGTPIIASITVDGITVAKHASSTSEVNVFLLPLASARTTQIKLNVNATAAITVTVEVFTVTNTVATPTDVQVVDFTTGASPHSVTLNVPTNGIGFGLGFDGNTACAAIAGNTITKFPATLNYYSLLRSTSGSASTGVTSTNTGWFMAMVSFAKA